MNSQEILMCAKRVGQFLVQLNQYVTCAESCTGGGIAYALTDIAGSSQWFDRGFIAYSNQAKLDLLGISAERLAEFGAVSEEIALDMALGAQKAANSDFALAVTGIAGPSGGTEFKPVGTVCFALVFPQGSQTQTMQFLGDRKEVREQSISYALELLESQLKAAVERMYENENSQD